MNFEAFAKRSGEKLCWVSADSIESIRLWANKNMRKLEGNTVYITRQDKRIGTHLCEVLEPDDGEYLGFWEIFPGSGHYQRPASYGTWELGWDVVGKYNQLIEWAEFLWSEWIENIFLAPDGSEITNLPD